MKMHMRHHFKIKVSLIIMLMVCLPMLSSGDLSRKKNRVGMEYWHGDPQESKRIALSFDDGPSAVYTEQILQVWRIIM
jgi:peptidoglycan/xylan/chitin deacetylase (PgdA/CDA1 family)